MATISGGRQRKRQRWQRCSASGASWLVEGVKNVETVLAGTARGRGGGGSRGNDERRQRLRSASEEGARAEERRATGKSERGQGVAWRVQGVGGVKQAGWRWPTRGQQAASTRPSPSVQGGRRQGAAVVGWAASYSTGPIGGRQVSFCQVSPSLSFYFYFLFCFSVFDLVIILNHF